MDEKVIQAAAKQFYKLAYQHTTGSLEDKQHAGLAAAQEFLRDAGVADWQQVSKALAQKYDLPDMLHGFRNW